MDRVRKGDDLGLWPAHSHGAHRQDHRPERYRAVARPGIVSAPGSGNTGCPPGTLASQLLRGRTASFTRFAQSSAKYSDGPLNTGM
jgi:hypothetical protein